jgi:hypothetical protein
MQLIFLKIQAKNARKHKKIKEQVNQKYTQAMATNRDLGLIQEILEKCELQSGKRQTPSFSKKFHETKTRVVALVTCVCTLLAGKSPL